MEVDQLLADGLEQWLDQKSRHRPPGRTIRNVLPAFYTQYCDLDLLRGSKGVETILGISPNIEYSINKRQRWDLLKQLPDIVRSQDGKQHVQLIEEMELPSMRGTAKVMSYVDNRGQSRVAEANRPMNFRSLKPDVSQLAVNIYVQRSAPKSMIPGEKVAKWCKYERRRMQTRKRYTVRQKEQARQEELFDSEEEGGESMEQEETHPDQDESASMCMDVTLSSLLQQRPSRPQMATTHRTSSESERRAAKHVVADPIPATKSTSATQQRTLQAGCKSSPLECLIPPSSLTSDCLREQYQANYIEGQSRPRRFAINIQSLLAEAVKKQHRLSSLELERFNLDAFVLFEEQQLLSDGLMRMHVWPIMCLQRDSLSISGIDVDTIYPLDVLVDVVVVHLAETTFPSLQRVPPVIVSYDTPNASMKWNQLFTELGETPSNPALPAERPIHDGAAEGHPVYDGVAAEHPDDDGHCLCTVCFDAYPDSQTRGTQLLSCQHWFCNDCWTTHIESSISSSTAAVQCPAPKCKEELDLVTMLRFITLQQYKAFANSRPPLDSKPCPTTNCTKLLRPGGSVLTRAFVQCECRREFCYDCLQLPHWPATCTETHSYHRRMQTIIEDLKLPDETEIKGKSCPKCKRFIYKESGCKYMSCPCGIQFCWDCLLPWATHPPGHFDACKAAAQRTRLVVIENTHLTAKYKWLQLAIDHRKMRQGQPWLQLRKKAASSLNRFCLDRVAVDRQDLHAFLTQQQDQLVTLCKQLHFIVEYAMVRIDCNQFSDSGERARFKSMVLFIQLVVNRLHDLFVSDLPLPLARMQHLAKCARNTLRNLAAIDR